MVADAIQNLDTERPGVVHGLPDTNRTSLVTGAVSAMVPSPVASVVLTALYPLATHMLLNDSVKASVTLPFYSLPKDKGNTIADIARILSHTQLSFADNFNLELKAIDGERSMKADISLSCPVSIDQIHEMYEIYDDHNFTFPVSSVVNVIRSQRHRPVRNITQQT